MKIKSESILILHELSGESEQDAPPGRMLASVFS